MFITKYYLAGAVALLALALLIPHWYFSAFLIWVSVSLFAVSFAYIIDSPKIFRKKQDGSIPIYISWIFYPFLLGAQLYNSWARKNDKVPAIQKVAPHLYLACRLFPSDIEFLKHNGVGAILDATAEFSGLNWSSHDENLAYLNVPILDHSTPHKSDLKHAINWIEHQISIGNSVVVHCALGRGRSVLIMAAYLLATGEFDDVDSVIKHINKVRGTARLNSKQFKKLDKLLKKGSLINQKTALVLVNPTAGGGKWKEFGDNVLQRLSVKYKLTVKRTTKTKNAAKLIETLKLDDFDVVIACGGDGTVNEVASRLVNTDQAMAIIPFGTTNALAHVLFGLKSKFDPIGAACEVIIKGKHKLIDTAVCNEDIVLLVAGIGFEEKMVTNAHREKKDKEGQLAYIKALVLAVEENESKEYNVSIDDAPFKTIQASSIVVANAAPSTTILAQGGGAPNLEDGLLDMTTLDTRESLVIPMVSLGFKNLIKEKTSSNKKNENIEHQQIKKVTIQSNKNELDYVVDGEVRQGKKIEIEVNPGSLKIVS